MSQIVKIQHHERAWDELAPSVQVFILVVPSILVVCVYFARKTRSLVWLPHMKQKAAADPFAAGWLLSPLQLGLVRLAFFLWTLYVWWWRFENPPEKAGYTSAFGMHAFYTVWNYLILEAFFLLAALYSFVRLRYSCQGAFWNFFRALLWTMYQQQLAASMLVAVVFWVGVWPNMPPIQKAWFTGVAGVNMHGVTTLKMLFELLVNGLPVHLPHAVFLLATSTSYLFFGVFVHGCIPSMSFLDLALDKAGVILFVVLAAHFVFYLLAWGLSLLKFALLNRQSGSHKKTDAAPHAKFQWPPHKAETAVAGN